MSVVFETVRKAAQAIRSYMNQNEDDRVRVQTLKRLNENADFNWWLDNEVARAKSRLMIQIMNPSVRGHQNDLLKSMYFFLCSLQDGNLEAQIRRVEKDINKRDRKINELEAMYGITK